MILIILYGILAIVIFLAIVVFSFLGAKQNNFRKLNAFKRPNEPCYWIEIDGDWHNYVKVEGNVYFDGVKTK